jgi:hypothetical protein
MTELLWTTEGDRVLEIGTGSGHQARAGDDGLPVTSIERLPELAARRQRLDALGRGGSVAIRVGDGSLATRRAPRTRASSSPPPRPGCPSHCGPSSIPTADGWSSRSAGAGSRS